MSSNTAVGLWSPYSPYVNAWVSPDHRSDLRHSNLDNKKESNNDGDGGALSCVARKNREHSANGKQRTQRSCPFFQHDAKIRTHRVQDIGGSPLLIGDFDHNGVRWLRDQRRSSSGCSGGNPCVFGEQGSRADRSTSMTHPPQKKERKAS